MTALSISYFITGFLPSVGNTDGMFVAPFISQIQVQMIEKMVLLIDLIAFYSSMLFRGLKKDSRVLTSEIKLLEGFGLLATCEQGVYYLVPAQKRHTSFAIGRK